MWLYFIPHAVYHLMRWFPKNNRVKIRLLLILCILCTLIPQIYVFVNRRSLRYCVVPIFPMLTWGIAFTCMMIAFSVLFALMDPVPYQIKVTFHVYGGFVFIYSVIEATYAFQAKSCSIYSAELYWYSLAEGILAMLCLGFFVMVIPFWLMSLCCKDRFLDRDTRTGLCYEPVNCCSCIWHV